eukprot:UN4448
MHWQPNRTWASADSRNSDCTKWRDAADCALPKQLWRTPKGRGDRGRGHLRNKTSHPLHPTLILAVAMAVCTSKTLEQTHRFARTGPYLVVRRITYLSDSQGP